MSYEVAIDARVWSGASVVRSWDGRGVLLVTASLGADVLVPTDALAVLSPTERQRFETGRNRDLARRFAVGRINLRLALAELLSISAASVPIVIGAHGKPSLEPDLDAGQSTLHFGVAHSADLLVLAFSRAGAVGVDVERDRSVPHWEALARRALGVDAALAIAGADQPHFELLRRWCRAEAELKASGDGVFGLERYRTSGPDPAICVADVAPLPLPASLAGMPHHAAVAVPSSSGSARQSTAPAMQVTAPSTSPASASTP